MLKKGSKEKIYILVLLISLCFTIGAARHNTLLTIVGTAITFFSMIAQKENAFLLMIGLIPNIRIIKIIGVDAAVLSYCFLITEIYLLCCWKKTKVSYRLLLFAFSITITALLNQNFEIFSSFIRCITFFIFCLNYYKSEENKKYLCENAPIVFVFGTVINIIFGIAYYLMRGVPIFTGRFSGISMDPNYYSAVIAVAISITILMISYSKYKLLYSCVTVILLVAGLLSVSRMFFLSLIWPIIIIVKMIVTKKNTKKILPVVLFGFIVGALLWNYISPLVSNMMDRFNSESTAGGNGRIDAWTFYLDNWRQSLLSVLFGLGTNLDLYSEYKGAIVVQHNFYVETLSEIGIVGALTMMSCFIELFKNIVNSNRNFLYSVPVLTALTCYFFLNALFSETSCFILMIGFLIYEQLNRKEKCANNMEDK